MLVERAKANWNIWGYVAIATFSTIVYLLRPSILILEADILISSLLVVVIETWKRALLGVWWPYVAAMGYPVLLVSLAFSLAPRAIEGMIDVGLRWAVFVSLLVFLRQSFRFVKRLTRRSQLETVISSEFSPNSD